MTFIILVLTAVWLDAQNRTPSASEITSAAQNGPLETLMQFTMMYLPVCTAALAGYGGSALLASLKTVGAVLAKPIAECVKNKE